MTRMGVVLSRDKMTPLELFYPRTECLPWSCSILGLNDTPEVVLSQDRTHPLESLYPIIEGLPWSRSISGQNDSSGVILCKDRRTPQDASPALNDSPGVVPS